MLNPPHLKFSSCNISSPAEFECAGHMQAEAQALAPEEIHSVHEVLVIVNNSLPKEPIPHEINAGRHKSHRTLGAPVVPEV